MSEIQKIREFESKIIPHIDAGDDETAHYIEDEAMKYFIDICHLLSPLGIKEAQEIFKRIQKMDFNRWCA